MGHGQPSDRDEGCSEAIRTRAGRAEKLSQPRRSFTRARPRIAAAIAAAAVAFVLFRATLLPGLDFGDTASFQVVAGLPDISPRDGYPLYFALARIAVWVVGGDPAHALNLTSAIESALACGVLALVGAELAGSAMAGLAGALLFASSYTLWSQSVIAEVYGLHMLMVALTLWLLLRWEMRPSQARLGVFFAVYALGFGNHLSMILLAPAYTLFLLASAPRGWRSLFAPRVIALAAACAAAGALQYAWNMRTLYYAPNPPGHLSEAIAAAWFDITKSDWRDTMVLNVPRGLLADHAAMYWFDLRQQFGWIGIALAAIGGGALWARSWRRGLLVVLVYLANLVFAYGYNVGDAHVFYLPSHLAVALMTCPAMALVAELMSPSATVSRARVNVVALLVLAYVGFRVYHDYPALDRSADHRPTNVLEQLTAGLDDRRAIMLTDVNWQVQNGLTYFENRLHPEIASTRMADTILYAPALIRDNHAIGRDVFLTPRAQAALAAAYGPLIPAAPDPRVAVPDLAQAAAFPPGTRYVLSVLKPGDEFSLHADQLSRVASSLTGGHLTVWPGGDYVVVAGIAGRSADLVASGDRPFRRAIEVEGTPVEVRMDSWLVSDTIRRMGFGHVIAGHRHTLIVERGVSLVAFDASGRPLNVVYASNLFAPQARYLCDR